MAEPLTESTCVDADDLAALSAADPGGAIVRVIEPLYCHALRHLPGGRSAIESALAGAGLLALPAPGCFAGIDPCLLWSSPTESLLIATGQAAGDRVMVALGPGSHALACVVDLSGGYVAFELCGTVRNLEEVLSRLIDSSAIPKGIGRGARVRLADVPVTVWRFSGNRVWLLADRSHSRHLARWVVRATFASRNR